MKRSSYEKVAEVLAGQLVIENKREITTNKTLADLGAEPMHITNIVHALGIEPTKYMKDGHLNELGRSVLIGMARIHSNIGNKQGCIHYAQIAAKGYQSNEGLLGLTVRDLAEIDFVYSQSKLVTGVAA